MRYGLRGVVGIAAALAIAWPPPARAGSPASDGATLLRLLGPKASRMFAPPGAPGVGALVRLPAGVRASDVGLQELVPGIARIYGSPGSLVAFADAHPGVALEVTPPLHLLLDTAARFIASTTANDSGFRGEGTLVGIADTGIDPTHGDFLDASGGTRVAWLLDLTSPPAGMHPDLEQKFGTAMDGVVVKGAVWAKADIDALLAANATDPLPGDEVGHGTLVAACAAGSDRRYQGVAPAAGLLVAKLTGSEGGIANDDLMRGVAFLFDRADAMGLPVVVNLSIGTDYGPHDGTL
ncbi:MAG: S8 family serine peptidase, partial [Myxococcales bacterium]|nr:S8 family serine peptidase [Myxococcales bacterium]